jgi:putative NADPH-quinone reductase
MKILVLYAHPVETSFNAALHRTIVERLIAAGHAVDDLDLYAEDFDPRLTRAERLAYHDPRSPHDCVDPYVRRLLAAEALVLTFPVWNYGFPAILKGFFDRVFLPGRFRAALMGNPPKKLVNRVLRATVKPGASVSYIAHYSMNLSTQESREKFMARVAAKMDSF